MADNQPKKNLFPPMTPATRRKPKPAPTWTEQNNYHRNPAGFEKSFIDDQEHKYNDDDFGDMGRKQTSSRYGKELPLIYETIKKLEIPKIAPNTGEYKKFFLDIIINGNYRIKYIPSCTERKSAENYCLKHTDEFGVPYYRLLPPNDKDVCDVPITDLNKDGVDDIVLIDRNNFPVIINGYKLVKANPYKTLWKKKFKTAKDRKANPFNDWIAEQMGKTEDIDWETGEYKFGNIDPNMQKYIEHFGTQGLGKPRVSKRATANGQWAKAFSRAWKAFWDDESFERVDGVRGAVDYLKLSSALFTLMFEIKYMKDNHINNYVELYRMKQNKTTSKQINTAIGKDVESFITKYVYTQVDKDGNPLVNEYVQQFSQLLTNITDLLFIGFNVKDMSELYQYSKDVLEGTLSVKELKADFTLNLTNYLSGIIGGYAEVHERKLQKKKEKAKRTMTHFIRPNRKYIVDDDETEVNEPSEINLEE